MARIHLIIGPVGAGKSTFGRQLSERHNAVRLTLDDWFTRLFTPDRPEADVMNWYVERARRCVDQIWLTTEQIAAADTDVVLEIGLIQRDERRRFYDRVDQAQRELAVYLVDADREVRRERVLKRNAERGDTFSMVVPPAFFEMASDLWQSPDADELRTRNIVLVPTASDCD